MKNLLKSNYLVLAFLLVPFLYSCKDDEAGEIKSPEELKTEKSNLLSGTEGKAWVLVSAVAGGKEVSSYLPACDRDNIYFLSPNGEGELRGGKIKCKGDEPEVLETGAWILSDDSKTVTMNIGLISSNAKIYELKEDRLQIEFHHEETTGVATMKVVN